jgi:phage baseplate assembly protein W
MRAQWYGYNAPFGILNGGTTWQANEKLIKNDILQILLTAPLERVMRPGYGSPIPVYVFEGITEDSLEQLRGAIQVAVEKYETRAEITRIDIDSDPDTNFVEVKIYARLRPDSTKTFVLELGLPLRRTDDE